MNWPILTVGDIAAPEARSIAIGPFGSRMKADSYVPQGVPVVRGNNIVKSRSPSGDFVYITDEFADSMPGCILREGDLVFPHRGAIGEVGLIQGDASTKMMLSTSLMKLRVDRARMDPQFVYYYFRTSSGRAQLLMRASTVGTPGIGQPLSSLRSIPIPVPSLAEQRAIAATLGALDDKVESNRRVTAVGESLIRALVESALDASEGADGTLGDYCRLVKAPVKVEEISADDNYIGLEHMPRGSIFLTEWEKAEGLGSNKTAFQRGDVLFGKLRPYFKKVGIAPVNGVCSTDILAVRPKDPRDLALIAVVAASDALIDSLSAGSTGTRMPRASWKDLAAWQVPVLRPTERAELSERVAPLIDRLEQLTFESRRLTALRDALLPELLSGRIRVPAEGVAA
ncbi:restriction endonuclease subunit S [Leucobacter sp.]